MEIGGYLFSHLSVIDVESVNIFKIKINLKDYTLIFERILGSCLIYKRMSLEEKPIPGCEQGIAVPEGE